MNNRSSIIIVLYFMALLSVVGVGYNCWSTKNNTKSIQRLLDENAKLTESILSLKKENELQKEQNTLQAKINIQVARYLMQLKKEQRIY